MEFRTANDLALSVAESVKSHRKARKLSIKRLSEMSGVSYGSMKRFEATGEISLKSLLKIAIVLDCADAIEEVFARRKPQSLQEIIDGKL